MAWGGDRRSPKWREQAKTAKPEKSRPQLRAEPKLPAKIPAEAKTGETLPAIDPRAWAMMLPEIEEISRRYSKKTERTRDNSPFKLPKFPDSVITSLKERGLGTMAMDNALVGNLGFAESGWLSGPALDSLPGEGLLFLGYTYLAELAQRPEYRVMSETIADDATREWIDFDVVGDEQKQEEDRAKDPAGYDERMADPDERKKRVGQAGKSDKVKALQDDQLRLEVKDRFYEQCRNDGFFGRSHLFLDIRAPGTDEMDPAELRAEIGDSRNDMSKTKCQKGYFQALRTIEPVWTYPLMYNAINPLRKDWYNPQVWFVMGQEIHGTRLQTFIGHPVPDMLKPSYAFGGLSLTQMAKPYVDIWLQTRQSVAALIHSFSVMVLMTDLSTLLQPNQAGGLIARAALSNILRDNQGLQVINKNTEDFKNVSASLAGLHELQAQAQEHMACLTGDTLVETDRGPVPIREVTLEDRVWTRAGLCPIKWVGVTGESDTFIEIKAGDAVLHATEEHPIWSQSIDEFVSARTVSRSHHLLVLDSEVNMARPSHGAGAGGGKQRGDITATKKQVASSIASFGEHIAVLFRKVMTSITETMMALTTSGEISNFSPVSSTLIGTGASASHSRASTVGDAIPAEIGSWPRTLLRCFARHLANQQPTNVDPAGFLIKPIRRSANVVATTSPRSDRRSPGSVPARACSVPVSSASAIKLPQQSVYNIEVDGPHEFFANGILVHNSVHRIPLVKFTGIQPAGLNASSESEIIVYDDTISAYQSRFLDPNLRRVINFQQLSLFGEIDPEIMHRWNPLREMTSAERGQKEKDDADRSQKYVDMGALSPGEVRKIIIDDKDLPYTGLDPDDVPEPPAEEGLLGPGAGGAAKEFEAEHAQPGAGGDGAGEKKPPAASAAAEGDE